MSIIHKALQKNIFKQTKTIRSTQKWRQRHYWKNAGLIAAIALLVVFIILTYHRFTYPYYYNKPLSVTKIEADTTKPQLAEIEEHDFVMEQPRFQTPSSLREVFV